MSDAALSREPDVEPVDEDVQSRIQALEEKIQSLEDDRDAYRQAVLKPRLDDLKARSDDARADRAELRATIEELADRVAHLTATVESLIGVSEPAATSPDKREQDLAHALIRQAKARSDDYAGKASKYYREVQDTFAELGHGDVSRPDCYDAMQAVAERPGFELGTKRSRDGNEVKCVRVDLESLRAELACSNPTTPNTPIGAVQTGGDGDLSNRD